MVDLPEDDECDSSGSMTLEEQRQSLHALQAQQLSRSLEAPSRPAKKKVVQFAASVDQDEARRQARYAGGDSRPRPGQVIRHKRSSDPLLHHSFTRPHDDNYDTSSLMALLDGINLTASAHEDDNLMDISSDEDSDCMPDVDGVGYLI